MKPSTILRAYRKTLNVGHLEGPRRRARARQRNRFLMWLCDFVERGVDYTVPPVSDEVIERKGGR